MIRKPVWAGPHNFYPSDSDQLTQYLEKIIPASKLKVEAKAVVLPHAGYIYSGIVAGKTISRVNIPDTVIILGPNHTGKGQPYSLIKSGKWITPLGQLKINEELAASLLDKCPITADDFSAHAQEHSIEVELPFLQYLNRDLSILPLIISDYSIDNFRILGEKIAQVIQEYKNDVLIIASSDMTHFESQTKAKEKDAYVLDSILNFNPEEMMRRIQQENVTMCGFGPVAVSLFAANKLGVNNSDLVDYQTSAEVTGDYSNVVGYAGIIIS